MRFNRKVLTSAVLMLMATAAIFAQTSSPSKPRKSKRSATAASPAISAADIQSLRDALAAQ